MNSEIEKSLFSNFLRMNWLRPENAVWDTTVAILLRKYLDQPGSRMDLGCGNGLTTFTLSGGVFDDCYDWYVNAIPDGFSAGKDIYNFCLNSDINKFIVRNPEFKWSAGLDIKPMLIEQARQLGLYDECFVRDCNTEFPFENEYDLIYSNIIYWLREPVKVIERLSRHVKANGLLILVFPNTNFFAYCESYRQIGQASQYLRILNRERAASLTWCRDLMDFQRDIAEAEVNFEFLYCSTYLSKRTLAYWDFGMRPFSPVLIKHVQQLSREDRVAFKKDWVESIEKLFWEMFLLEKNEVEKGVPGGFNFVVLKKNA